jgi:hypothetical protein
MGAGHRNTLLAQRILRMREILDIKMMRSQNEVLGCFNDGLDWTDFAEKMKH